MDKPVHINKTMSTTLYVFDLAEKDLRKLFVESGRVDDSDFIKINKTASKGSYRNLSVIL